MSRKVVLAAIAIAVAAATANAGALLRLSTEFQSQTEIFTTAVPIAAPSPGAPGGTVVYDKTISIPLNVAYITFTAQADTHDGAALLMSASITDADGTVTVCQPMATAGGSAEFGGPWMTLLKLPTDADNPADINNCDDGGGGSADCHDNSIVFSCCAVLNPSSTPRDVQIRMASSTGGTVFYEDSTVNIDALSGKGYCQQVGTGPH
jgi:hypothetical protein